MNLTAVRMVTTELQINGEAISGVDQVTMRGLESIVSFLAAPYSFDKSWMSFISIGSGELDTSSEDKVLENEIWRKEGTITINGNVYTVATVFEQYDPEESYWIREVGLWSKIAGGDLGVRWALDEFFYKDGTDQVNITCNITIN